MDVSLSQRIHRSSSRQLHESPRNKGEIGVGRPGEEARSSRDATPFPIRQRIIEGQQQTSIQSRRSYRQTLPGLQAGRSRIRREEVGGARGGPLRGEKEKIPKGRSRRRTPNVRSEECETAVRRPIHQPGRSQFRSNRC